MKVIEDDFLRDLLDLFEFPENGRSLGLDGGRVEGGIEQNVREDGHGARDMLGEGLGVVDRVLAGGIRVQLRPHILDLEIEPGPRPTRRAYKDLNLGVRKRRDVRRTLEGEVLEEVGDAVGRLGLGARAGVDLDGERGGAVGGAEALGGDGEAVRERADLRRRRGGSGSGGGQEASGREGLTRVRRGSKQRGARIRVYEDRKDRMYREL